MGGSGGDLVTSAALLEATGPVSRLSEDASEARRLLVDGMADTAAADQICEAENGPAQNLGIKSGKCPQTATAPTRYPPWGYLADE